MKFDDFNDANEFITNYLLENNHPCKHGSRNTIDQFNRKIRAADQRITDLPGDSVYSLRWICKHFGSFKSRAKENDNGKSRSRSHYSRGCQFFVYLSWDKREMKYVVKSCNMDHNHDIGPQLFPLYASNRQPDSGQRASDMLAVGAKPSLVADVLHRQNIPIGIKDVYNMRQKLKFRGSSEDELLDVIRANNLQHTVHTDEAGTLECLTSASPQQLHLLRRSSDVRCNI